MFLRQLHKSVFLKKIFGLTPSRNLCVLVDQKQDEVKKLKPRRNFNNTTVAAVFENLKNQDPATTVNDLSLDEIILNAKTVNGLLNVADNSKDLKRKHALKVGIHKKIIQTNLFILFCRLYPFLQSGQRFKEQSWMILVTA